MIKEQEKRLFEHWQTERGYPSFIADGVFDEKLWTAEPLKLTFVLKEANWRNGNVDLCKWVLDNTPWKTWNNIARWTKGMLEGGDYPAYLSVEERNRLLSRVSFLNLKKTGGGSRTDSRELRVYAHADAPYIRKQLLLYKPDVIVCCGKWIVADSLEKEVLQRPDLPGPFLPAQDWEGWDGAPCCYTRFPGKERLTPVISFRHPEKRYSGHVQWRAWYAQIKAAREMVLPPDR